MKCGAGWLKISWAGRISNEEVLRRLGTEKELLVKTRVRQMRFEGRVIRGGKIEESTFNRKNPR